MGDYLERVKLVGSSCQKLTKPLPTVTTVPTSRGWNSAATTVSVLEGEGEEKREEEGEVEVEGQEEGEGEEKGEMEEEEEAL